MDTTDSDLAHSTAELIHSDIAAMGWATLPAMTELARRYRVSKHTVMRASHLLRDTGLLQFHARGRMHVTGTETQRTSPADMLFHDLSGFIESGQYGIGSTLPKTQYISMQMGISKHTVIQAYRRLAEKGLVHKQGRSWVVGGAMRQGLTLVAARSQVMFVLSIHKKSWADLTNQRTSAFAYAFAREADNAGVQLQTVFTTDDRVTPGSSPVGIIPTINYARKLGDRFLGTLIPERYDAVPNFDMWIDRLLALGKPVVWFDSIDEGLRRLHESPHFFRCHFCEQLAVDLAVSFLGDMGHRSILFPGVASFDWHHRRGSLVKRAATNYTHPINVDLRLCPKDSWPCCIRKMPKTIQWFRQNGSATARKRIERFLRESPGYEEKLSSTRTDLKSTQFFDELSDSKKNLMTYLDHMNSIINDPFFREYFQDQSCTAIIVPNDRHAEFLYYWLDSVGIQIPRDLSIISFDNYEQYRLLPVSTVDFGFGSLGYAAFHAIAGDIDVKKDSRENHAFLVLLSKAPPADCK